MTPQPPVPGDPLLGRAAPDPARPTSGGATATAELPAVSVADLPPAEPVDDDRPPAWSASPDDPPAPAADRPFSRTVRENGPNGAGIAKSSRKRPRELPEDLADDTPTLRRMLRPDLTPRSLRRAEEVEERASRRLAELVTDPETGELVRPRPATARHPSPRRRRPALPGRLGYQPGLDGLRALSLLAVLGYHAGFGWLRGGWIGVEIFFVVSGYLITTLLIEEREGSGAVGLRQFWIRRARRLLPVLGVVLAAVAAATLVIGSAAERAGVRRDLPWALVYLSNWGQITGAIPYYATELPLLRHLWSLAIEEQFYLLWPFAFLLLTSARLRPVAIARLLAVAALASMVVTFVVHAGGPGPIMSLGGADRVNFMYLSTITRASGLLLGCAAAFVWRPGRRYVGNGPRAGRILDHAGAVALALLVCIGTSATLTDGYVYQWLLPIVSVLALVAVLVAVHPASEVVRRWLSWRPLVEVGRRSYGWYLWHWPVFVFVGATDGSVARFAAAMAVTVAVSELTYRFVETPARQGAIGRWWHRAERPARQRVLLAAGCGVLVLAGCYAAVRPYDPAAGGGDATFAAPVTTAPSAAVAPAAPATTPAPPVVRLAIVGDSQAHSLAVNLPDGIESAFDVEDGSLDGCSVYDEGRVRSARTSFRNYFELCAGWEQKWADAVTRHQADVALVVLGAWDVFDRETADGRVLRFGTPEWDADLRARLQRGIDALVGAGAKVAILEVPCMRPISVEGAAVPPLPERADDARVAHVNELFRAVAAENAATTTFVEGPDAWCADETVATDTAMRWDGVHVYKPGAKLIFDTIAPALLAR